MPLKELDQIIYTDNNGIDRFGYYLCPDIQVPSNCLIVLDTPIAGVFTYDNERTIVYANRFVFKKRVPICNVYWALEINVKLITLRRGLSHDFSDEHIMKILSKNPGWTGLSNNSNLPMKGENNGKSSGKS